MADSSDEEDTQEPSTALDALSLNGLDPEVIQQSVEYNRLRLAELKAENSGELEQTFTFLQKQMRDTRRELDESYRDLRKKYFSDPALTPPDERDEDKFHNVPLDD